MAKKRVDFRKAMGYNICVDKMFGGVLSAYN